VLWTTFNAVSHLTNAGDDGGGLQVAPRERYLNPEDLPMPQMMITMTQLVSDAQPSHLAQRLQQGLPALTLVRARPAAKTCSGNSR
jgi:hypothetical protein